MYSKKDSFSTKDKFYMNLALNLASERVGLTGPNPSVGCVIVKNDRIISTGQTSFNGRPHAENNAIKKAKKKLKGATIYVSLEPCSHYGKTPPCTDLIKKSKINKLFFSINDIDKRSSNKAYKILESNNILVKRFLLKNKAKKIYKSYFFSKKNKIPYVSGKIACSKDYFISSKIKYITNKHSRDLSHLLRYKNQGILISSKTLNKDNPKLTCRLHGLEKLSPKRFIIDKSLKTNKNSSIVKSAKRINTYIFFNKGNLKTKKFFTKSGVYLIKIALNKNNQFDLKLILKKIYQLGVKNLIVEGGKKLTSNFLEENLYNEFYLFKSSKKLGKKGSINILNISKKLSNRFNCKKKIDTYLDKDKLINYY